RTPRRMTTPDTSSQTSVNELPTQRNPSPSNTPDTYEWDHLDRDNQVLYVSETFSGVAPTAPRKGTKTQRVTPDDSNPGRWVPFPAALTDWLLELQPDPLDGYLIRAPKGGHFPLRNFYRKIWTPAMNNAVDNAGIVRFDLVDLRHTFSSYLHDAGVPDADLMDWMGHTDPRAAKRWRRDEEEESPDVSTNAFVYRHGTNAALGYALSVLTETIAAVSDATGRHLQLRLSPTNSTANPSHDRTNAPRLTPLTQPPACERS
ncbi:MAG: hypothetical protein LC777_04120, partial [Actinobacteria bacterium]|nr:hypothetical protein [Actinomycetota bacterium]